jgi:hypothetical protein
MNDLSHGVALLEPLAFAHGDLRPENNDVLFCSALDRDHLQTSTVRPRRAGDLKRAFPRTDDYLGAKAGGVTKAEAL